MLTFMSWQWSKSAKVQALACYTQHVVFVSQEADIKKVCRTLHPLGDVVAKVKSGFEVGKLISRSLGEFLFRHCQCLAHVSPRQEHLNSRLHQQILGIRLFMKEREDGRMEGSRENCAPPRIRVLRPISKRLLHGHELVVEFSFARPLDDIHRMHCKTHSTDELQ